MKRSGSLNYGEVPAQKKGADGSARAIMQMMKNKGTSFRNISNSKQVGKKFESLLVDSGAQLDIAKRSCPKPENPYKYLLKLPGHARSLKRVAQLYKESEVKAAFKLWLAGSNKYIWAVLKLQNWAKRTAARIRMFALTQDDDEVNIDASGNHIATQGIMKFSVVKVLRTQSAKRIQTVVRQYLAIFKMQEQAAFM